MSKNAFQGSIPSSFWEIGFLTNSRLVWESFIRNNTNAFWNGQPQLRILHAFQNNSNLVSLNLRDNLLIGNIPDWIGNLSSLSILLLGENHLEGRIPNQLFLLQNLNLLDLSYNKFSGTIPHSLSNITFVASTQEPILRGFSLQFSKNEIRNAILEDKIKKYERLELWYGLFWDIYILERWSRIHNKE